MAATVARSAALVLQAGILALSLTACGEHAFYADQRSALANAALAAGTSALADGDQPTALMHYERLATMSDRPSYKLPLANLLAFGDASVADVDRGRAMLEEEYAKRSDSKGKIALALGQLIKDESPKRALDLAEEADKAGEKVPAVLLARLAEVNGQEAKSASYYEKVLAEDKENIFAHRFLAEWHHENGRPAAAKRHALALMHGYNDLALAGDANAAWQIVRLLEDGRYIAQDLPESRRWATYAASIGEVRAMRLLARHYLLGAPEERDATLGTHFARAAVELDDADAAFMLGYALWRGETVARDPAAALPLLEMAAAADHPGALTLVGRAYLRGEHVAVDPAKAKQYLDRAIAVEAPGAMTVMAVALIEGNGYKADRKRGLTLLDRAEALGDPSAKAYRQRWL